MNCRMLIPLVTGLLVLAADATGQGTVNPGRLLFRETLNLEKGELAWRFKDRLLLVYAFGKDQFKPYVRELYTLRGDNVLRDAPADHLHHHGLMFAIRVNGVNFWEEVDSPGFQKSIRLVTNPSSRGPDGQPRASFTQLIHWLASTNQADSDSVGTPLLIEERTLTLTVDERNEEVALRWEAAFEVGPGVGSVRLHGANYNGLGLRLPQSFDKVARFANSENAAYTGANTQNVIPAQWTSVAGTFENHDIMLVLFGHPKNARGDGRFFSMTEPFAYLSATQGLDQTPLEYTGGQKFRLRYLLTVCPSHKSREFIAQRSESWRQQD